MSRTSQILDLAVRGLAAAGAVLLLIQAVWITYGVIVRYVFNRPDRTVTEATALLLVPLAFVGLPYAFRDDALPRVSIFLDRMRPKVRRAVSLASDILVTLVGAFFTYMATSAAVRTYLSGVKSFVIGWPEYLFWASVAVFIGLFTICVLLKTVSALRALQSKTERF